MNTRQTLALASSAAVLLNLGACSVKSETHHHHHDKPVEQASAKFMHVVPAATPEQERTLLGRVRSLEGEWENVENPGHTSSIYRVSSNGSVVREIMLPGTPHEMTNIYHMDGPSLVMTHYCAEGNQPRMRATSASMTGDSIALKPDSVTNLRTADEHCMASMTIHFVDANTIRQEWRGYKNNRPEVEHAVFTLKRRG